MIGGRPGPTRAISSLVSATASRRANDVPFTLRRACNPQEYSRPRVPFNAVLPVYDSTLVVPTPALALMGTPGTALIQFAAATGPEVATSSSAISLHDWGMGTATGARPTSDIR